MIDRLLLATVFVWMALVVVWVVGALRTKRSIQSQSSATQLLYTAILVVGVYLIFAKQSGIPWLDRRLNKNAFPLFSLEGGGICRYNRTNWTPRPR